MFIVTLFLWRLEEWIRFWFTNNSQKIKINSIEFCLRSSNLMNKISDLAMIFEVVFYRTYGACKIETSDIVIDIGAHIGSFSLLASEYVKKGKVYAYEPFGITYNYLKRNVELNNKENILIFSKAVGKKTKDSELYVNNLNLAETSLYKKTDTKQPIKVITLSKVFKDNKLTHCDVLKLDCEGAEYDILFSSKSLLPKIKRIILEAHEPKYFNLPEDYTPEKLIKYLEENNFKVIVPESKHYQRVIYAERK